MQPNVLFIQLDISIVLNQPHSVADTDHNFSSPSLTQEQA